MGGWAMSQTTIEDRYRRVLIGLVAGDRMALLLAESLLNCGGFNPAEILECYLGWWREGPLT